MFYTYVLRCGDGDLYVGSTTDLRRRVAEHSAGKVDATAHRQPVVIEYYEAQAVALPISTEDIFRRADLVARVRVQAVEEARDLGDGESLWRARVQAMEVTRGIPSGASQFDVSYKGAAVKYCPEDSMCLGMSCPEYARLTVGEEVTVAASYRNIGGLQCVLVLSHNGSIKRDTSR
ncbi:MAG: GIY-YIG nuclease family protein [Chthoniobacterales bacterium]